MNNYPVQFIFKIHSKPFSVGFYGVDADKNIARNSFSAAVIKRDYHSASTTPSQPEVVATKEPQQQVEEVINPEDIPNEGNLEEVSDSKSRFLILTKK